MPARQARLGGGKRRLDAFMPANWMCAGCLRMLKVSDPERHWPMASWKRYLTFLQTKEVGPRNWLGCHVLGIAKGHGGFVSYSELARSTLSFTSPLPGSRPEAVDSERDFHYSRQGELVLVWMTRSHSPIDAGEFLEREGYTAVTALTAPIPGSVLQWQDKIKVVLTGRFHAGK